MSGLPPFHLPLPKHSHVNTSHSGEVHLALHKQADFRQDQVHAKQGTFDLGCHAFARWDVYCWEKGAVGCPFWPSLSGKQSRRMAAETLGTMSGGLMTTCGEGMHGMPMLCFSHPKIQQISSSNSCSWPPKDQLRASHDFQQPALKLLVQSSMSLEHSMEQYWCKPGTASTPWLILIHVTGVTFYPRLLRLSARCGFRIWPVALLTSFSKLGLFSRCNKHTMSATCSMSAQASTPAWTMGGFRSGTGSFTPSCLNFHKFNGASVPWIPNQILSFRWCFGVLLSLLAPAWSTLAVAPCRKRCLGSKATVRGYRLTSTDTFFKAPPRIICPEPVQFWGTTSGNYSSLPSPSCPLACCPVFPQLRVSPKCGRICAAVPR